MSSLPDQAQVVIIGAGISGNMVASHLARLGWRDMVLLDQGPFPNPGGSTGHSSSMIWLPEASRELDAVTAETNRQYRELGVFTQSGGLEVARTPERLEELKRRLGMARIWGHEARLVTPDEIRQMVPYVDTSVVLGGIFQPETGVVDPVEAGRLVRERAEAMGALRSWPFVEILGIDVERARVAAVRTSRGTIRTERVIVCGGVWAARLGRMAGVSIPLTAGVVQAIHVGPLPIFESRAGEISFPIVRDVDSQMYMRQHGSSMEVGSYATTILLDADDIPSIEASTLTPTELPITWNDFEPSMERALELMPDIFGHAAAEIPYAINGLVSVSSDGLPILGEAPEVRGFWSVNRVDVKVAPTVARLVAEWMTNGDRAAYPHPYHIARFHDHERTEQHVRLRGAERFSRNYRIIHPYEEFSSGRDQRLSPMHARLVELGAVFTEGAGWELPRWFGANEPLVHELGERVMARTHPWDKRGWSPIINAEHLALRDRVALEDTTAQAVFEVTGPGAAAWIDGMAVTSLDVPAGCVVPTWLLGPNGSVASEVTIARLAKDRFWILAGVARQMRDAKWLRDNLPADGSVSVHDATSGWCSIGVWGPRSRELLASVCPAAREAAAMAPWTVRLADVGGVRAVVLRTTRLGDPGWEVFAPMEQGLRLWDTLWEAGGPLGVVATGNAVSNIGGRLEAGLASRAWELVSGYDLVEAGLGAAPKAADFVGKAAYLEQLARPPAARLCRLEVEDHRSASGELRYPLGGEPVVTRTGEVLVDARGRRSFATSAGSVPPLGKHLLFAYLPPEHAVVDAELAVEYFAERFPVRVIAVGATPPAGAASAGSAASARRT